MRVVEVREETKLREMKDSWEMLLRSVSASTTFSTWEWITAWWSAYGTAGELRLLAAFDETNVLRGIAPLRVRTARRYSQTVTSLSFAGDGTYDSDYLDFILAQGYEQQVMKAFGEYLTEHVNCGTVILLNEIPDGSPALPFLTSMVGEAGLLFTESAVSCSTVHLPNTWEDYLAMLRPRFRTKVRSVLRSLDRNEITVGFCDTVAEAERLLPTLFDLHTKRWAQDGKPGVFRDTKKCSFYSMVSAMLLERGSLRFSWMRWKEEILACQYGFTYGSTYFHLQEGYEPASEHWNVGIALRAWSVRELLKQGVREYDFLGGVGRHKTDWGAVAKQSKNIQIARATYKNLVFCRGPEWEISVRDSVAAITPKKILAVRRARLEKQQLALARLGNVAPQLVSRSEWLQKAGAHCYFQLRLPVLTRGLRDWFQVSFPSTGSGSAISLERRKGPSARILCYHRVNDENDPFFPAIPVKAFEHHMRYLAQRHKVVSLAGAIDHLCNGATGNVVAITLDDGYRDNFEHAFPIFQRYGLPATIFLATGSIDGAETLWFDRLAHCIKTTAREFVDLEIDIPRRFWLRTDTEKLHANSRIVGFLRGIEDELRRYWLSELLRQLSTAGNGTRGDKMLTWDHVRLMKANGIDFGGHTVTHPYVSKATLEQATWEATECKRRIEQELQSPVDCFAYPNGRPEDYTSWTKEVLRGAGYRAAVSTVWGKNYRNTDPMELRRGGPWEQDPALFACKMDWYQLIND